MVKLGRAINAGGTSGFSSPALHDEQSRQGRDERGKEDEVDVGEPSPVGDSPMMRKRSPPVRRSAPPTSNAAALAAVSRGRAGRSARKQSGRRAR